MATTREREFIKFGPGPRDIRIAYRKSACSKGEAWDHLWENAPCISFDGKPHVPFFRPGKTKNGEDYLSNPYRKDHDDEFWAWTVKEWHPGTPKLRKPKPPKPVPKSRYELLLDDGWLGVQDPS